MPNLSFNNQLRLMREQLGMEQAWSAEQAQRQMDFQERMSNTAHQREVQDLIAAGLNPVLSAGGSGASSPSGAAGNAGSIASMIPQMLALAQSATHAATTSARAAQTVANTSNTQAEEGVENPRPNGELQNIFEELDTHVQPTYDNAEDHNNFSNLGFLGQSQLLNAIDQELGSEKIPGTDITFHTGLVLANAAAGDYDTFTVSPTAKKIGDLNKETLERHREKTKDQNLAWKSDNRSINKQLNNEADFARMLISKNRDRSSARSKFRIEKILDEISSARALLHR